MTKLVLEQETWKCQNDISLNLSANFEFFRYICTYLDIKMVELETPKVWWLYYQQLENWYSLRSNQRWIGLRTKLFVRARSFLYIGKYLLSQDQFIWRRSPGYSEIPPKKLLLAHCSNTTLMDKIWQHYLRMAGNWASPAVSRMSTLRQVPPTSKSWLKRSSTVAT